MSGELPQQREVGDAGAMRGRLKLRTPEGSESGSLSSLGGDDAGTSAAPCEDSEGGSVSSRGNDDSHDGCLAASDGMQQVRCALRLDVASAPGSSMATPSQWSAGGHVHTSARCSSGAVGVAEQPPEQGSQAGSPDVSVGTSVVVPCGQEPRPAKAIAEGPSAELEAERAAEGTESQRLQADQHLTTVKLRLLIRAQDAQLAKHREDLDRAERRAVDAEAKLSRMEAREAELLAKLEQQEAEKAVRLVRLQGEKLELEGRCARLQKALEDERELWESRDQEEIKTPREAPQRPDESRAFLKAAHTDLKTFLDQGPEKRRLSSTDVFERPSAADVSFGSPSSLAIPLRESAQAAPAEAAATLAARCGQSPRTSLGGGALLPRPRAQQAAPVHRIPAASRASVGAVMQAAALRQPSPVAPHRSVHGAGAAPRAAPPLSGPACQVAPRRSVHGAGAAPRAAPPLSGPACQIAAGAPAPTANLYYTLRKEDKSAACETETGTGAGPSRAGPGTPRHVPTTPRGVVAPRAPCVVEGSAPSTPRFVVSPCTLRNVEGCFPHVDHEEALGRAASPILLTSRGQRQSAAGGLAAGYPDGGAGASTSARGVPGAQEQCATSPVRFYSTGQATGIQQKVIYSGGFGPGPAAPPQGSARRAPSAGAPYAAAPTRVAMPMSARAQQPH